MTWININEMYINMSRSTINIFLHRYRYWYKELTPPRLGQKSEEFMILLTHISEELNILSSKAKQIEGYTFTFRCNNDIKNLLKILLN